MSPRRTRASEVLAAVRDGRHGRLPPRYTESVAGLLRVLAADRLVAGAQVLDVGSGPRPVIAAAERPPNCCYAGLDLIAAELAVAPAGTYDEIFVWDITQPCAALEGRFDLVLSWWVLEHVHPLNVALENIRQYLKPGGRLIAYFAARRSAAALANRLLPHGMAKVALNRFTAREPNTVFPAIYDRCVYDELVSLGGRWAAFDVRPLFHNAQYLEWCRPAMATYLGYEEWAYRGDRANLATHLLLAADA